VQHVATGQGTSGLAKDYLFNGSALRAGLYTVRLTTAGQTTNRKLVLVN
jgi:hypothetical protein